MREHPDLEQLKRQAKELLEDYASGKPEALAEVRAHYRPPLPVPFALHHAQLVIARAYGFDSWSKLKAFVDGVTVLRLADAIRAGDETLSRSMLKARPELATMSLSYGDEHQPIHFAVMRRSPELVRLLMQLGADARAGIHPHREATKAITLAIERGYDDIAAIIEEEERRRASSATPPSDSVAPPSLHGDEEARAAVASGDIEWLRSRHASGGFTNPVRWDGGGLLTAAVTHDQPEVLALLLGFGFDPNERTSIGEGDWISYSQGFPLWQAAAAGKLEMAATLLAHGADPNAHVDSSGSSVYSAYSHRQWPMAELLVRHGGIVSADIAAIYRKTELVRQMLDDDARGALRAGICTSDRPLAEELLGFAADAGATEIVRMALDRIDWPREDPRWFRHLTNPLCFWHHIPWLYAGNKEFDREGYLAGFRLILARSGPNPTGAFNRKALHAVAATGSWVTGVETAEFARTLLEAGARTDVRDDLLQSTPLGWACRWGRIEVVRLLLEHGADPVERDAEPWASPRAWALKMGRTEILDMLDASCA